VRVAEEVAEHVLISTTDLTDVLGQPRFESEVALRTSMPGVATGLAWTSAGGDILFIEATRTPGGGRLILTGQLGDVMRESAQAALSLVKSRADMLGIDGQLFEKAISTFTCRPVPPLKTARARVSPCLRRWSRC
jgi:ATP-dependent Lon protease